MTDWDTKFNDNVCNDDVGNGNVGDVAADPAAGAGGGAGGVDVDEVGATPIAVDQINPPVGTESDTTNLMLSLNSLTTFNSTTPPKMSSCAATNITTDVEEKRGEDVGVDEEGRESITAATTASTNEDESIPSGATGEDESIPSGAAGITAMPSISPGANEPTINNTAATAGTADAASTTKEAMQQMPGQGVVQVTTIQLFTHLHPSLFFLKIVLIFIFRLIKMILCVPPILPSTQRPLTSPLACLLLHQASSTQP